MAAPYKTVDDILETIASNDTMEGIQHLQHGRSGTSRVDYILVTDPQNGEQELFRLEPLDVELVCKKLNKDDRYAFDIDHNFFQYIRKHCLVGMFE